MSKVRRSLGLAALDSYVGLALQIISTAIIARLLTPEQLGTFAVAAVFAAVASTFRDFGVTEYLIQERALDDNALRAAMTVNLAASWLMGLLLLAMAPYVGRFYAEPGVTNVMQIQALSFALIPFGAVTMSWFRRQMNLRPFVQARIAANIVSFCTSVSLALLGWGYLSLAWGSVANVATTVAVSLWLRPASLPRWPGLTGVSRILKFGKHASGIFVFAQIGRGAPELILGRALGMSAVGFFSRANGLVELFNRLVLRAILPVTLPYLSRGARQEGSPRRAYLQATSFVSAVGWPVLVMIALSAESAIWLLYGTQWATSVPLARILCLAGMIELWHYLAKDGLLAVGKPAAANVHQFLTQASRIAGLLLSIPFGLQGACIGLVVASVVNAVVSQGFLRRHLDIGWRDLWHHTRAGLWLAAAGGAPLAMTALAGPATPLHRMLATLAAGLVGLGLWMAALHRLRHPLWPEVVSAASALRRSLPFRR